MTRIPIISILQYIDDQRSGRAHDKALRAQPGFLRQAFGTHDRDERAINLDSDEKKKHPRDLGRHI